MERISIHRDGGGMIASIFLGYKKPRIFVVLFLFLVHKTFHTILIFPVMPNNRSTVKKQKGYSHSIKKT